MLLFVIVAEKFGKKQKEVSENTSLEKSKMKS